MDNWKLKKHVWFDQDRVETDIRYSLWHRQRFLWWDRWVVQGWQSDAGKIPLVKDIRWAKQIAEHYGIEVPE